MGFWSELSHLLFSKSGELSSSGDFDLLIFACASSIMGFIIVLLDLCGFYFTKKSLLGLNHSFPHSLVFLLIWGFGAGIAGFIGGAASIFQLTRIASVTAGVAWSIVLPKLLQLRELEEEEQIAHDSDKDIAV